MLFGDNSEDDESCSSSSNNSLFNEIEDFVIECAVFESQRWLEIVTGEGCAIPENLPKSLLEGKQLRKLVNLLLKRDIFIFNTFQSPPTKTIFERARIQHEFQNYIYDNDWISQFLIIANISFKIFPKYLFFHADLSNTTKNNSLTSKHYPQSHIEYSFHSSRDALRRICVTVLKLSKLYKEQYPDCNKTHIFDPEEGRKLLDLHKQKICNHPIELQIRKRPRFTFSTTTPSMNFTNKKYGAQSLPRGATTDLSRNRRNSDFNMQSCSINSPLQDIIAANEDVERWRERRRRSMNRTSEESSIIIEESKPLLLYSSSINCSEPLHVQASPPPFEPLHVQASRPPLLPPLPNLITHPYLKVCIFIRISQRKREKERKTIYIIIYTFF
uniref:Uncharacterized protein n=1 Tax=Panagrolaimus sp. PS1159 TaxID=55785 RepID=A0AC35GSV7_9BILA